MMPNDKAPGEAAALPQGQRFTQVYLERGRPTEDSQRARRRLAALIDTMSGLSSLPTLIPAELGVDVVWGVGGADWHDTLARMQIRDVLDLVTVAYRLLRNKGEVYNASSTWVRRTRRIFDEENLGYTVDDAGGVHYRLDDEFARNKAATIAALQAARYANSLNEFDRGMTALIGAPADGKGAIRGVFAAVEGLFRLAVPNAPRLGAAELSGLEPLLNRVYAADATALRSAMKMLAALKDWTDAAHFYRHEQGAEAVAQPPMNLTVHLVSTGASYLRWLAELDSATRP